MGWRGVWECGGEVWGEITTGAVGSLEEGSVADYPVESMLRREIRGVGGFGYGSLRCC